MPHRVHSRVIVDERLLKAVGIASKLALSDKRSVEILEKKNLLGKRSDLILLLLASRSEMSVAFESVHGNVVNRLLFMLREERP
jgi:hypothetical protein